MSKITNLLIAAALVCAATASASAAATAQGASAAKARMQMSQAQAQQAKMKQARMMQMQVYAQMMGALNIAPDGSLLPAGALVKLVKQCMCMARSVAAVVCLFAGRHVVAAC